MNAGNISQNGIGRLHMPHFIHGLFLSNEWRGSCFMDDCSDWSKPFIRPITKVSHPMD